MSERRKWDKQAPEPAFAPGRESGAYDAADPVREKQVQYIKMLEERNRLKKKLAAASKKEARDKQREDAFVTTFNVPATGAAAAAQDTIRKNKSSAALLPTKMYAVPASADADRARGRSAPSTTLPLRRTPRGAEDAEDAASEAKPEPAVRRAKWSKPAVGEAFGVESRNGKARFCVGAKEDEVAVGSGETRASASDDENEKDGSEDDYLEESFEEFEGIEDADDAKHSAEEKVLSHGANAGEALKPVHKQSEAKVSGQADAKHSSAASVSTVDAASSAGLSRTTTDLFGVIQNLSRSKQKALVDVLQKFESSAQQESDVQSLQSSIGDPAIWRQVTKALFGTTELESKSHRVQPQTCESKPSALTIDRVLEEQRQWEEEYARQMQQRLAEEREAKEIALREAEHRRALLMKQMEDEEKELERLMEQKRLQRLARLKALEEEEEEGLPATVIQRAESKLTAKEGDEPIATLRSTREKVSEGGKKESSELTPDTRQSEDAKDVVLNITSSRGASESEQSVVPKLVLPSPLCSDQGSVNQSKIELRLRLLSTWGKTRAVGLTQICAYDINGGEVDIDPSTVKVYEQPDGRPLPKSHEMMRTISRLFNGIAQTTNDQDMWLGRLSDNGMLEIAFEVDVQPSKLCVWNYNSKLCSACVRDVEVLLGGKSVWSGSLPQGFGDEDDNICTWISVGQGAKKTARLATSRTLSEQDRSVSHSTRDFTTEVKSGAHVAPSRHGDTGASASGDSSTAGAPIWLSSSRSASVLLPTTKDEPGKVESKDDVLHDLHAPSARSAGSLTSRRQRTEPIDQVAPSVSGRFHEDITEHEGGKNVRRDEFLARKERERLGGTGALTSSWDSLEHFSKTSRSRLPSATEEVPQVNAPYRTADDSTKGRFVPTTTSGLLAELRGSVPHVTPPLATTTPRIDQPVDIPELPSGRRLKLEILSTWGDVYYVGLNGIEMFDQRGKLVTFAHPERQIVACPSSINVLEEYDDDPRVAKNLIDGVNCTCDDFHMWLAPFTQGEAHHVTISFDQNVSISMVRIWNYNKSRAHTCRGVRHVRLILLSETLNDLGRVIFEGEIRRAPGGLFRDDESDNAVWCEVILFTTDQSILKKIEANDALLLAHGREQEAEDTTSAIVTNLRSSMEMQRPRTADSGSDANNGTPSRGEDNENADVPDKRRPMTSAKKLPRSVDVRKSVDKWMAEEPQQKSPVLNKVVEAKEDTDEEDDEACDGLIRGRRITLRLLTTWGDRNYIGLCQIDVLIGSHGTPITLDISNIDATPRDLATLGYDGDPRTLDKLINGVGTTCDDANMWLVPFGGTQEIRIDLKREQFIYGIRVWNYNKSLEDSFRGVKQVAITVDGELISPRQTGFVLRKAPGTAAFDFDQILRFDTTVVGDKRDRAYMDKIVHPIQNRTYKTPNVRQDYEPPLYPQGFVLRLVLWCTWGDPYYIGLNGIELYDASGKRILTKPSTVTAQPHSLADIDLVGSPQDDVRVPENLLSGKSKNTWDASDAWLAPLASSLGNSHGNVVFVVFDSPVVLSLIKFWNYSKTPERGVKDIDIYLDDILIFSGSLRKAPHGNSGQNIGRFGSKQLVVEEFSQPVLFSTNQAQVDAEKRRVFYCGGEEQDVLCINEGQVVQESKAMYRKPDPGAEGVVVDLTLRPMTAMGRK